MRILLPALVATALALPAAAQTVAFDGSWKEQGFLRFRTNDYQQGGASLGVASDGTVSLLWKALPEGARDATKASWSWGVTEGVPPTDLARKGGDDRDLALYFAWTEAGASVDPARAMQLLRAPTTRVLVYVRGGDAARGTVQRSPYLDGMRTVVLRPAGTGSFSESVDLAADFRRAFGTESGVLVGVGVSADSDDTKTRIRATVSNLALR
ncbi:DUF3047 domain-containing protein [Jannaschia sp. W003]|uniref:DUF3047 domain-containing protein n=1 Tax=Jannaschia sp. W003 TaxID=2867012 RepID=UPI0021A633DA|nr:DUF3047 domain-containing protein [Jannaschia sp. W003]UWQ22648.1 DUF3047 domain-containing protein [Jannaschia sp. W003]